MIPVYSVSDAFTAMFDEGGRVQRGRQPLAPALSNVEGAGVFEGEPPRLLESSRGGRREPSRSSEGREPGHPILRVADN